MRRPDRRVGRDAKPVQQIAFDFPPAPPSKTFWDNQWEQFQLRDRELAHLVEERRRVEQRVAILRAEPAARSFGALRFEAELDVADGAA